MFTPSLTACDPEFIHRGPMSRVSKSYCVLHRLLVCRERQSVLRVVLCAAPRYPRGSFSDQLFPRQSLRWSLHIDGRFLPTTRIPSYAHCRRAVVQEGARSPTRTKEPSCLWLYQVVPMVQDPRTPESSHHTDAPTQGHQGWWQYDRRTSSVLEEVFLRNRLDPVELCIGGSMYIVDLALMVQVRV